MPDDKHQELIDILTQGEQFTRVFVQPMVEAIKTEMKTHVDEVKKALNVVADFESRVKKLEANQTRALWGWGVFASGVAGAGVAFYGWIKSHIKIG